jgi:3-oxoacyl-[acyl-carrier-protein] synthase-3
MIEEIEPVNIEKTPLAVARKNAVSGKSWFKARPLGVGACAGNGNFPNSAYETLVDTSDKWITKRTGISNRHIIQEGSLRDIAIASAKSALASAVVKPEEIDLVIVATSSPDDLFGDAPSVALAIGATNAAAFDITAACSGFVFGMVTASQFLNSGTYKKVLVVGADALTRFIDWTDRGTCILFGDGAGAMVFEATESVEESGVMGFALHSNAGGYCNLNLPYVNKYESLSNNEKTVVNKGEYGKMFMNGAEVYKFAVSEV